jgi:hypothetical protein
VLEAAGPHERVIDGRQVVSALTERVTNRVEVAKRRKVLERAREQAFPLKQLQEPPRAGVENSFEHRHRHDCAGVDQQLRARRAGEGLFPVRIEGVAKGARGDSQQAAIVALSGKQGGVLD